MNNNRLIVSIVVLIAVIGLIGWYLSANSLLPGQNRTNEKLSGWQAVFLTNGQVYFGKASDINSDYVDLKNIYYLQLAQSPQPADQKNASQQQSQQISLVKLGNELHGPADDMKINRSQILFIEDMKSDAKVVQAIDKYQKEGPSATASTAPAVTATP